MAEQEQNRSQTATPFKLAEARKKGMAVKSMDTNSLLILTTFAGALIFFGANTLEKIAHLCGSIFSQSGQMTYSATVVTIWIVKLFKESLLILLPILTLIIIAAIIINFIQTGPIFSFHPIKPDWNRLNLKEGFQRIFSLKILIEGVKTILKTLALGLALYMFISEVLPIALGLMQTDVKAYPKTFLAESLNLIKYCLIALLPLALFDFIYVRREFAKKLMMSKREVTEEHKQREGDPRIRQKIRELQREARKRSGSLQKVKDADVLITNPTRLAIAIKYDRTTMLAPIVLAKGAGNLAALMRESAHAHKVPVAENKRIARLLFRHTRIDQAIPEESYRDVARLLTWALAIKNRQKTQ